uniref:Uncharacterized protein n=1 Tax=Mastacembelus armatus TaxID=205130 RepID=A0A7N9AZ66_9TELE
LSQASVFQIRNMAKAQKNEGIKRRKSPHSPPSYVWHPTTQREREAARGELRGRENKGRASSWTGGVCPKAKTREGEQTGNVLRGFIFTAPRLSASNSSFLSVTIQLRHVGQREVIGAVHTQPEHVEKTGPANFDNEF